MTAIMPSNPQSIGTVHLVGIGGIGMSGIAEVMHNLGYTIQGSDMSANANVKRLQKMGIEVKLGHDGAHIAKARIVVISSAIKDDNPELRAARDALIPVVRRAEMLAELMRLKYTITIAGTHGKTTTTSMVAAILDSANLDPTVMNGGIINAYGTNARLGAGEWMVVEADESDGTFVRLPSTHGVITNIDPEHLDYYGDFEGLKKAFQRYVENIPFYGAVMMCIDHPEVQALMGRVSDRRMVSYGLSPQADIRAVNIQEQGAVTKFDLKLTDRHTQTTRLVKAMELPMAGLHNLQNALAAIAIGFELGVEAAQIKKALAGFAGVKRRFTHTGHWRGVDIYDDYAHHPVEIKAVLSSARSASKGSSASKGDSGAKGEPKGGRVIAVVQPHRYTRLRDLFDAFCGCFNEADSVIIAPVYAAGENPIAGINADAMAAQIRQNGHRDVMTLQTPEELPALIREKAQAGDVVICMGAGNITLWAQELPDTLNKTLNKNGGEV